MVTAPSKPRIPPAAQIIYNQLGWEPTGPEQEAIVACRKQRIIVRGGEGGGKSTIAAMTFLGRWVEDMVSHPDKGNGQGPPLLYWLVGDDYSQVTEEFRFIEYGLQDLGYEPPMLFATKQVAPGRIELKMPPSSDHPGDRNPRLVIETKSGGDPTKISRARPEGIIVCEAGQIDHLIFERVHGRALQGGGWLFMVGTLEGSMGWYPQLSQAWESGYGNAQTFKLPSWTNKHVYPEGRKDPKILQIEREQSDEYFKERIAGEVVPPRGLVFGEFRADLHIKDVSYHPRYSVYLCHDPGYAHDSAVALLAVQNVDGQIRVVDEIYDRGLRTDEVIDIAKRKIWWRNVRGVVSDPHYKDQHHSVHSVHEVWIQHGEGLVPGGERVDILPGIERLKTYLKPDPLTGNPGLVISPHCQGLLSEFGAALNPFDKHYSPYRWKTDRMGTIVGDKPEDEYNHAIKALIYWLVYTYGYTHAQQRRLVHVKRR